MKYFLTALLASTLSVAISQAAVISDSFPANFNNFTVQNTLTSDGLSWSSANGVGGVSGRIDASGTGNHADSVYYSGTGSAITKSYTDVFESSIFFLTGASITTDIAQVSSGFIRSTGSAFNTAAGGFGWSGELRNDGGGTVVRIDMTGSDAISTSSTLTLQADTWYELVSSMDLFDDDTADSLSVSLYSRGADGTSARTFVNSTTATNVSLANGGFTGDIYTGFGGGNNTGSNIAAFDNFAVIPEPGTLALFGIALGTLAIFRRRK